MRKKKLWSPHRYLVAAARKTWRWSPARTEVLKRVQLDKEHWRCEGCNTIVTKVPYMTRRGAKKKRIDGAVDHREPIGKQPRDFEEYPAWLKRMYCSIDNLQFLCTECHSAKTKSERKKK